MDQINLPESVVLSYFATICKSLQSPYRMLIITQIFTLFANKISIRNLAEDILRCRKFSLFATVSTVILIFISSRRWHWHHDDMTSRWSVFLTASWRNDTQSEPIEMHNPTKSLCYFQCVSKMHFLQDDWREVPPGWDSAEEGRQPDLRPFIQ